VGRPKKEIVTETVNDTVELVVTNVTPTFNDIEWTDYVLSLLSDDEKISGNPTTDGLRRVFETALNCTVLDATSEVVQSPSRDNENRATVTHTLHYYLNDESMSKELKYRSVSGAADVYWGNCDKVYRNHPVAVAETRAEGRALRRALKLRKVVAAEELAKDIEDHPDHDTINKITNNQINFMDVLAKRLNINIIKLLDSLAIDNQNIYNISYEDAVKTVTALSGFQQTNDIPQTIIGYDPNWK
jgi:hypothetical protein